VHGLEPRLAALGDLGGKLRPGAEGDGRLGMLAYKTFRSANVSERTVVAFDKVAYPFCVSRRSVLRFAAEQYSPDCQRISPTSES